MAPRDSVTRMGRRIRAWPATEPLAHGPVIAVCLRRKGAHRVHAFSSRKLPTPISAELRCDAARDPAALGLKKTCLKSCAAAAYSGSPDQLSRSHRFNVCCARAPRYPRKPNTSSSSR
jgi:hypothetical protein